MSNWIKLQQFSPIMKWFIDWCLLLRKEKQRSVTTISPWFSSLELILCWNKNFSTQGLIFNFKGLAIQLLDLHSLMAVPQSVPRGLRGKLRPWNSYSCTRARSGDIGVPWWDMFACNKQKQYLLHEYEKIWIPDLSLFMDSDKSAPLWNLTFLVYSLGILYCID